MFFMKRVDGVPTGRPTGRPIKCDLLDGSATNVGCAHWTDQQLADLAGWDRVTGYDPEIDQATGGGVLDPETGLVTPATVPIPVTTEKVSAEAERRIGVGILVDGKAFRSDDVSVARVQQMRDAFIANMVDQNGVTFRTAAGDDFTLTSQAQAEAIYFELIAYRGAVLSASANLQDDLPSDFSNDSYWPGKPAIEL